MWFPDQIHSPNIQTFVSLCPNNSNGIYINLNIDAFSSETKYQDFFLVSCWAAPMLGFPTEQNKAVSSTKWIHLSSVDT